MKKYIWIGLFFLCFGCDESKPGTEKCDAESFKSFCADDGKHLKLCRDGKIVEEACESGKCENNACAAKDACTGVQCEAGSTCFKGACRPKNAADYAEGMACDEEKYKEFCADERIMVFCVESKVAHLPCETACVIVPENERRYTTCRAPENACKSKGEIIRSCEPGKRGLLAETTEKECVETTEGSYALVFRSFDMCATSECNADKTICKVKGGGCNESFETSCRSDGKALRECNGNWIRENPCASGKCEGGVCVFNDCRADGEYPACDASGGLTTCENGREYRMSCPSGKCENKKCTKIDACAGISCGEGTECLKGICKPIDKSKYADDAKCDYEKFQEFCGTEHDIVSCSIDNRIVSSKCDTECGIVRNEDGSKSAVCFAPEGLCHHEGEYVIRCGTGSVDERAELKSSVCAANTEGSYSIFNESSAFCATDECNADKTACAVEGGS